VPREIVRVVCGRIDRSLARSLQSPHNGAGAVYFLWHFPSARLEPDVPDVIRHTALRSSDFPLLAPERGKRPSGPAAYSAHYTMERQHPETLDLAGKSVRELTIHCKLMERRHRSRP
jgi:hypothetical protein